MMYYRYLFILIFLFCCLDTYGQIYICVDQNGQRHYSDKRCPTKKQTASIDKSGKERAPDNVQIFTSALKLLKRSYALLTIYEPENREYFELYNLVTQSELKHMRFMSNPMPSRYGNYSPFNSETEQRIISNLSDACRHRGYFTVCAAIEGNPWISARENNFFKQGYKNKYTQASNAGVFCDKAIDARAGGVISDQMMDYFCRSLANK